MADVTRFEARPREAGNKGAVRALRRSGWVPGVVYGDSAEQVLVSLESRVLRRAMLSARFASSLCQLDLDGRQVRVLPREVQTDPVTDEPIHIDFMRVARGGTVTVTVPVTFHGEDDSPGLKRGGVLNIVRREVEVVCPADAIPEEIAFDVSKADINDSIHFSQAKLPANVEPTITDRDFTVASISAPTVVPEEEEAEAAAAEPEAETEGVEPESAEAAEGGEEESEGNAS